MTSTDFELVVSCFYRYDRKSRRSLLSIVQHLERHRQDWIRLHGGYAGRSMYNKVSNKRVAS